MTRLATITATLLLLACGSDPQAPTHEIEPSDEPAGMGAGAFAGNEALTCKHGPWQYRRIRNGNYLSIDCSAGGRFSKEEAGNVQARYVSVRAEESVSIDLAKEPSEWPHAECFLTVGVTTQVGLNTEPTNTTVQITLSATETSARVDSSNPGVAPSVEFAADECERKEW